ncbi:diguanylate cyclase [Desulfobacterales bacterium HSG17]|nr:diguanylate cyclase [Desulfobacterales bacterium HSG17]
MSNNLSKQRILIVDDETANIKILASALQSHYHISFALNGEASLKLVKNDELPDLILLDIVMPGINGYEVCVYLKKKQRTKNIPIIFITSMSSEEDETKGLEIGAVDYITKPFSMPIVKARIKTHLELKRHRDILEHLSSYDGLTGIPNRRQFDEYIKQEWKRAARESSLLSLIMIDIDHFKLFNDSYGHWAGDDCLRKVAQTLAGCLNRPSDLMARYGGEEFAAILPRTDQKGAVFMSEKIRKTIEDLKIPNCCSLTSDYLTVSIGTATIVPSSCTSPYILINGCDNTLYEAKHGGRNQVKTLVLS